MTNPPAEPGAMPEVLRELFDAHISECRRDAERLAEQGDHEQAAEESAHADAISAALTQLETQLAHLRAEGAKDRARLARIDAFARSICEHDKPSCGVAEYHDSDGFPVCAACYERDAARQTAASSRCCVECDEPTTRVGDHGEPECDACVGLDFCGHPSDPKSHG